MTTSCCYRCCCYYYGLLLLDLTMAAAADAHHFFVPRCSSSGPRAPAEPRGWDFSRLTWSRDRMVSRVAPTLCPVCYCCYCCSMDDDHDDAMKIGLHVKGGRAACSCFLAACSLRIARTWYQSVDPPNDVVVRSIAFESVALIVVDSHRFSNDSKKRWTVSTRY